MLSKRIYPLPTDPNKTKLDAMRLGLIGILNEEQASEALENWSTYFNETSSVFNGVNSFAKEICKRFDKNDQQRALVRALNRALLNIDNNSALLNDNLLKKNTHISNTESLLSDAFNREHPVSTPAFQTFQYLLNTIINLFDEFEKDKCLNLRIFLKELTQNMPWSDSQQQQLVSLISSGKTTQIRSCRPDQLKSFLNHLRLWMEDEVGNENANRLITKAVKIVQLMPVSTEYAATKFL